MPDERNPGNINPNTNQGPNIGGGGGGGFRNFGGFRFGSRFGSLGNDDLTRLTSIFGGVPNLFDLTGAKGNNLFRNGTIRAGGLRKLLKGGTLGGGDADFIQSLLGNLGPGPGFSGKDEETGEFILGQGLAGLLNPRELNRLQSILAQRPNKTNDLFKGGAVNFPDLRRLFNELSDQTPAKDFIGKLLGEARFKGVDDVSNPDSGPGGGAPVEAGGGTEGSGGQQGFDSNGLFPGGLGDVIENLLKELAGGEGFPKHVLRAETNRITGGSKQALRDNLLRAEERLSARGLSDSGLGERAFEDIEDFNLNARNASLDNLGLENARAANQQQATALQGILGLGGLNLDSFLGQEGIRLGDEGLALERLLGERGLDLRELEILINSSLQELFANLGLGGLLGG